MPNPPVASLRAQNKFQKNIQREILRCYILRNSTVAHGIVEWAPSAATTPTPMGRLRSFEAVACSASLSNAQCTIAELPFAEAGLGSKVWESSLALASWALMNQAEVSQRRVLELGSGCGFGGVMLAAAGARSVRGASHVCIRLHTTH